MADEFTAQRLGIKKGMLVLLRERVMYGAESRPVEAARTSFRADRYTYRIRL